MAESDCTANWNVSLQRGDFNSQNHDESTNEKNFCIISRDV